MISVFANRRYLQMEEFLDYCCDELKEIWNQHPNDSPIRVSFAGKTRADYITAVREFYMEQNPGTLYRLTDKIESLNLAIAPDANEMIALRIIGNDEASAKELRAEINGMLDFFKRVGVELKTSLEPASPSLAKTTTAMFESLETVGEGREANIIVGKPATMPEVLVELKAITDELFSK